MVQLTPPNRDEALVDFVPFPDGTEDAQREAYWAQVQANWREELVGWEQTKAADQFTYDHCAARVRSADAAEARQWAKERAAAKRARAAERAAARRRCTPVGAMSVRKSRPSISCSLARQLARVSRSKRLYAGWRRASYVHGYSATKLVTREDAHHELHVYRLPTDPYMQAIWRKGNLRVVVGSGGCDGFC